jgi:hypothetical protein
MLGVWTDIYLSYQLCINETIKFIPSVLPWFLLVILLLSMPVYLFSLILKRVTWNKNKPIPLKFCFSLICLFLVLLYVFIKPTLNQDLLLKNDLIGLNEFAPLIIFSNQCMLTYVFYQVQLLSFVLMTFILLRLLSSRHPKYENTYLVTKIIFVIIFVSSSKSMVRYNYRYTINHLNPKIIT